MHHRRIFHWLLIFQEFEFKVVVRPVKLNVGPDHLSRIDTGEEPTRVKDDLPDAHLFRIEAISAELEEITQLLENGQALEGMSIKKKQILAMKVAPYSLINKFLYKMGLDEIIKRCVLEHEIDNIMYKVHYGPAGGHFQADTTAKKIQQLGLWWLTLYKDCKKFVS